MREIHQGLPLKNFIRPSSGIVDVTVCTKSGLLRTAACNEGEVTMPFLEGTQPAEYCNIHGSTAYTPAAINFGGASTLGLDDTVLLGSLKMPTMDLKLLPETRPEDRQPAPQTTGTANTNRTATPARPGTAPNAEAANRNAPGDSGNRLPGGDEDINPGARPPGNSDEPEKQGSPDTELVPAASDETNNGYGIELPAYNPLLD
jgi:penicillin-binding protein 1A